MASDSTSTSEVIWHYTTADGLYGILQSRAFFATATEYLNDSQELTFGTSRLLAAASAIVKELGGVTTEHGELLGGWYLSATLALRNSVPEHDAWIAPRTYTTSFSREGDLLSQWRAYGGERGFAIGVDRKTLNSAAQEQVGAKLSDVKYGGTGDDVLADEVRKRLTGPDGEKDLSEASIAELMEFVAQIKHAAFSEEKEVRLQLGNPEEERIKARVRGDSFVTYVEVPFQAAAVTHVRVGPGRTPNQIQAVTCMLNRLGYKDVEVSESAAPYRT